MGIQADFFVAPMADALKYEASLSDRQASLERFHPAEYKNLTDLELGILWAILLNEKWDVKKHMLTPVKVGEDCETWLYSFPKAMTALIANLSDPQLQSAAESWAKIEELSDWTPKETGEVLTDLRRLAKQSLQTGNMLFLWGSL